jgi:GT2 family glycosyltransferase
MGKDGLTDNQKKAADLIHMSYEEMEKRLSVKEFEVSIIIPVYNGEKYILEAVISALNQTIPCEVIVVNDGSTDKTHELLCGVPNITYLIKPNGGTASALNIGIRNSNGNWIHWLSADDVLYEDAVEKMLKNIDNNEKIYYSNYDIIDENSGRIGEFIEPIERNFRTREERFKELMGNYYGNGSSSMIHRSVFEKIGYFDESIQHSEDYEFMLRAISKGIDLKLIPIKTLKYRYHSEQMTHKVGGSLNDVIRSRYK